MRSPLFSCRFVVLCLALSLLVAAPAAGAAKLGARKAEVNAIVERVAAHDFYPVENGRTQDRHLKQDGIANLSVKDWRVRLLAIRDLVRLGKRAGPAMVEQLDHNNWHVRQITAKTLGLLEYQPARERLADLLENDPQRVVRAQAALSLGRIGGEQSLELLKRQAKQATVKDVRHRCRLAAQRIERGIETSESVREAYASLAPSKFDQLEVGKAPPDFTLKDTDGQTHQLSDYLGDGPVVLIWIFSDWCPVCHGEFEDLIRLRERFNKHDIDVMTIQAQDRYRSRVMVGGELVTRKRWMRMDGQWQPEQRKWWPHLVDPAGRVGAKFGVQPQAYAVHSEWVNRPATIIIGEDGKVKFAYYGTYWGDRPSIENTLEMTVNEQYEFEHPKRLKATEE